MLALQGKLARVYTASRQLIGGDDFNNHSAQLNSENSNNLTATVGGGQANALQLIAANNTIAIVANANDSIKLPKGHSGLNIWVTNAGGASMQVFTFGKGTINGTDGLATGVAQANNANTATLYHCMRIDATIGDIWVTK